MKKIKNVIAIVGLMLVSVTATAQIKSVPYGNYTVNRVTYGTFNVDTFNRVVEGSESVFGAFRTHPTHLFFEAEDVVGVFIRKQNDTGYDTYVNDYDPFGSELQIHVSDATIGFWDMISGEFRIYFIDKGL